MQNDHHNGSETGAPDSSSGNVNPYAAASATHVSAGESGAATISGPYAGPGWGTVRDGLVLVFMGNLGLLGGYVVLLVLMRSSASGALLGAVLLLLAALATLVGKWMCRNVPENTGLRDSITIACLAFTYQWLSGVATATLTHGIHPGPAMLALVRFSTSLAELIGMGCFLWFLTGLAQRSADERLIGKAKLLFGSFMLFDSIAVLSRLITFNSTGHLAHHAHIVHHLQPLGPFLTLGLALPLLGGLIAWAVSYLSLIKSLADTIDAAG